MQGKLSRAAPVALGSSRAAALFDEGRLLLQSRDARQALDYFDSAQQLGYDVRECAAARWNCWMLVGEFEQAWRESDLIASVGGDLHAFWDGELWSGKRVMLRCLHGLGDTIQFVRYAPLLKETCHSLIVQTHPQLVTLIQGVQGIDHVFTWGPESGDDAYEWDIQMEVTELPRAFRTTISTVPATTPYIRIPMERIEWASGLFQKQEGIRIGLAWEAGPWDPSRSIPPGEFVPLFECHDYRFYALQKGADLTSLPKWGAVYDLESHAANVLDTAALMLNLDLVITVDTMTAHLAGALARPVWILLPSRSDWRWMLDRRDTPWYPAARLFRQKRPDEWCGAIEEVCAAMRADLPASRYFGS